MRYLANKDSKSLLTTCKPDALYRVLFVGGPLDGYVARTETLPHPCLELPSGPAEYGTDICYDVLRRFARYRWASTRLASADEAPVLALRYEYQGWPDSKLKGQSLWRRGLTAVRQWLKSLEDPTKTSPDVSPQKGSLVQG